MLPLKQLVTVMRGGGLVCLLRVWIMGIRWRKQLLQSAVGLFLGVNAIAALVAYPLTHLKPPGRSGFGIAKPQNSRWPDELGLNYTTQRIPLNQTDWLETWFIPTQKTIASGTALLFPGNMGTKGSHLLGAAQGFSRLGYDSLLVDFRGVGGSSGQTMTIGMREARDVAATFHYAQKQLKSPIVLYGVSMGSAAVLRAVSVENINPDAIMLELPFARLVDTVKSRLRQRNIPAFPAAELLVFWGGLQHGFNGLAHNPITYARDITCPVWLHHGKQDKWTSLAEIKALFENFPGAKTLVVSPNSGHHQLVGVDRQRWDNHVKLFLASIDPR